MRSSIDQPMLLRTAPIFAHLTDTQLARLASALRIRTFPRRATIFHLGDSGQTLYLIVQGQVRIYLPSATGCELTITICRAGDFFGELALIDGQPRSASAEAMLPTTMLTLQRSAFVHLVRSDPAFGAALLTALAARLRASTAVVEHLAIPTAQQRLGRLLIELARCHGVPEADAIRINLHLTQDDLASLAGLTRETVNRQLTWLCDQGLAQIDKWYIRIPDCARLEQYLVPQV